MQATTGITTPLWSLDTLNNVNLNIGINCEYVTAALVDPLTPIDLTYLQFEHTSQDIDVKAHFVSPDLNCPIVNYQISKVLDSSGSNVDFTSLLSIDSTGVLTILDFS